MCFLLLLLCSFSPSFDPILIFRIEISLRVIRPFLRRLFLVLFRRMFFLHGFFKHGGSLLLSCSCCCCCVIFFFLLCRELPKVGYEEKKRKKKEGGLYKKQIILMQKKEREKEHFFLNNIEYVAPHLLVFLIQVVDKSIHLGLGLCFKRRFLRLLRRLRLG